MVSELPGAHATRADDLGRIKTISDIEPFSSALAREGISLVRTISETLQINVGFLCNQTCKHCHMEAGPDKSETMDLATVRKIVDFTGKNSFQTIDITGGAPELNPHLVFMIESFSGLVEKIMIRSNLTSLGAEHRRYLMDMFKSHNVVVVASFPSSSASQLESQRGTGVFLQSLEVLKSLNSLGYGRPGSGLQLDLVCNPTGAFLPTPQIQAEKKFRFDLQRKWGVTFNNLYTFANVPIGRFRHWLTQSGNYERYMRKLVSGFNPCTVAGLMCRSLISVSWNGYLYDCDFNQALGIPAAGLRTHISEVHGPPAPGTPIAVSDHCYACTAGSGFT
ncbi:MAG TPA: arsenosugar biosynthesis radical SAM (seleno)protein ArsS [Desulfomonilaceae bacterium]|nr:arsenosugar biosynthesis radical SAM (seleno)protein ArsS [Desulfomonilaceae bacterium]